MNLLMMLNVKGYVEKFQNVVINVKTNVLNVKNFHPLLNKQNLLNEQIMEIVNIYVMNHYPVDIYVNIIVIKGEYVHHVRVNVRYFTEILIIATMSIQCRNYKDLMRIQRRN